MKILIPLLFIVFSKISAECTSKDLTSPAYLKSVGKEKIINHFSTPRDQDGVGWCGAYASSDSLSFAVGEPVSAIDTSINFFANSKYYQSDKLNQLESVFLDSAPQLAMSDGYCPESVIPSNKTLTTNLTNNNIRFLLSSFQAIYDSYVAKGRPNNFCVSCTPVYVNNIKKILPSVTEKIIKEVLKKDQTESLAAFKGLLDNLCEGKRIKVEKTVESYTHWNLGTKTFANLIDEALDNDSMPSIGMNSSHFIDPSITTGGNFSHAMVVVAKRMNKNNKCEYLLRNSYGKGCIFYNKEIAKKCDSSKGSIWMDEDQIKASTDELMVIKNKAIQPSANNSSVLVQEIRNERPIQESNIEEIVTKVEEASPSTDSSISKSIRSLWKSFSSAFKYKESE